MVTKILPQASQQPAWMQQFKWISDPVGYMEGAAQKNPDIFYAKIASGNYPGLVFVQHPEALQYILTHDRKELSAPGDVNGIVRPLVGDNSLILAEGNRHTRQRKLLMPPFHGDRMRTYGELICDITHKAMSKLTPGESFLARDYMQEISLQVMVQSVFGIYEGERYQQIIDLIRTMFNLFASPLTSGLLFIPSLQKNWTPWGLFQRPKAKLDRLLYQEITERRQETGGSRSDILSLLMSAQDENGEPMTDIELHDELVTLLFAGHETTATAMAWSLYWVNHHREIRTKLQQEVASLGDNPETTEITKLPYLSAVCNETLRIYSVGMLTFPRVTTETIELLGYELEPDTVIVGCMYLTHHREEIYPNSYSFKPERFLERQFSPYEFIPFGAGSRRCIGAALAVYEMKLVLATIIRHYSLNLVKNQKVYPQRRGITLAPKGGIKMTFAGKKAEAKELESVTV